MRLRNFGAMSQGSPRPFYTRGRFILPVAALGGYALYVWRSREPARPLQGSQTTSVAEEPPTVEEAAPARAVREVPSAPPNTPVADPRRVVDKGRLTFGKRD